MNSVDLKFFYLLFFDIPANILGQQKALEKVTAVTNEAPGGAGDKDIGYLQLNQSNKCEKGDMAF